MTYKQIETAPDIIGLEAGELDLNKILLVDDIPDNRLLLQLMFRDTEFTLSEAASAGEALTKARIELPALIVSDIQMPGLSGFELVAALKADPRTQNIGVILVTAHHRDPRQISHGLNLGADDYISRPFIRDEFLARVQAVLRVKAVEVEVQRQARMVERRNERLQLVNELALAVNSASDLQAILLPFLSKLAQLIQAELVVLILLNEEKKELTASMALPGGKQVATSLSFSTVAKISDQILQNNVSTLVLYLLDQYQLEQEFDFSPSFEAIQYTPLLSREQMVGTLAFVSRPQTGLDEADWTLVRSMASIIAVAVENAHLLESAQQQVDDLIALNEVGRALTSTLDLEQVLKQTTLLMQRALLSEAALLWLLDEASQEIVLIASSGRGASLGTGYRLPLDEGLVGYVVRTGEPHIVADSAKEQFYFPPLVQLSHYQPRSILSMPVQVKGKTIGVMQAVHQKVNWFDQDNLRLSYSMVSSVGIAVENARLFNEVQTFSRQLEGMVTERTRQLAAEKEKSEAILGSMADGLLVLDAQDCILTANTVAEDMLEFYLSEQRGQPISSVQQENPLWQCVLQLSHSPHFTDTALVDIPTSPARSIQAHSAQIRHGIEESIGTVIVLRDITTLKEVERMKARFMAGVTHELKTPLSVIRLHAQNLLAYHDRLSGPDRVQFLNAIQTQTDLLEQLIEDILQLSRLDAGLSETKRQALDLVEVIDETVNNLRPLAEAKHINLIWQKPASPLTLLADRNQVERVVRNLLDNAIKYTSGGGSITVNSSWVSNNGQSMAQIRVNDTGIGIPPEHQAHVFERFYRVDPSHTVPGTGLGLSIVKEIVTLYGGNIHLESMPGWGSAFTITLPALPPA
ncbi:MAG: GAF domain-containing protein [Anaerolineae bacterium]|nr:GAF domain-containing protein [Anaerolineae bacterium]